MYIVDNGPRAQIALETRPALRVDPFELGAYQAEYFESFFISPDEFTTTQDRWRAILPMGVIKKGVRRTGRKTRNRGILLL
jgi:hypothetical protein